MRDTTWASSRSQMFDASPASKINIEVFAKDIAFIMHPGCVVVNRHHPWDRILSKPQIVGEMISCLAVAVESECL